MRLSVALGSFRGGKRSLLMALFFCLICYLMIWVGVDNKWQCKKSPAPNSTRILILGAGMAGVSAAKYLQDLGYTNILVLEGSDRVGGRIKEVQLGSHTIETGAQFIHGTGNNPIFAMAIEQEPLHLFKTDYSDFITRDSYGSDITSSSKTVFEKLERFYNNYTASVCEKCIKDTSLKNALRLNKFAAVSALEAAMQYYVFDFMLATPPKTTSFQQWDPHATYQEHNTTDFDDAIVSDVRGYSSIVRKMAGKLVLEVGSEIKYNHVVNHISQADDFVTVVTTDTKRFIADYVVVTFSLGVLQSKDVRFEPPLSKRKSEAIENFEMFYYNHLFFKFTDKFWDDNEYIIYAGAINSGFTVWRNLDKSSPGCKILQAVVTGEFAKKLELSPDNQVVSDAMKVLRTMYANVTSEIPKPTAYYIPKWSSDPLFRGSFSNWPTGFEDENFERLVEPDGRIFFAGEHTNSNHLGYAHGAYYTGKRVAMEIDHFVQSKEIFI